MQGIRVVRAIESDIQANRLYATVFVDRFLKFADTILLQKKKNSIPYLIKLRA
jgi:hypothetical protein